MSNRRPRIAGEKRRSSETSETAEAADAAESTAPPPAEPGPQAKSARPPRPTKPSKEPRPTLSGRARLVLSGLGLAAVAAVAFAVIAVVSVRQVEGDAQRQIDAEDAATEQASTALVTMLSYGYASVADDLAAATELMTDDFAAEYEQLAPQVASAAEQRKIDVTASVRAVAPLGCGQECSTSSVRLLAFVDQHRTVAGKAGSPAALSAIVRMEKVDGRWLVAELTTT
ncbi:hypothetical protein H4N58_16660 [Mumia sp. ZJ1417]|uniref:hypothetical protein n=1 Tax=Mumia sp. ZJ1417 TaxID=2708082 RepID=UPI00141F7842|nr:hypothetical protein [Mumia sp. ZJ1417]QMW65783.1 hypothetical protein H4N58_16660 [Mumia sp. ZJ1417]